MNKTSGKSYLRRTSAKTLYLMTLFTLAALAGVGLFIVPGFNDQSTVSAQEDTKQVGSQAVTPEMLRIALDFRSAHEYAVFAEKGINDDGNSNIKGDKGVASRDGNEGARVRKDLGTSMNAINQLPATEIGEMKSGSFRAGVYSARSANLSGNLVLDAENDPNAIFIFRVESSLRAENDLNITLANGAEAHNVFFVSKGTASIGEGVQFKGNVIAQDDVTVGRGSKVFARALSVGGTLKLTSAAVGGGTGILEICKAAGSEGLAGRVFAFRIGSLIREAPVGGCTGPIDLTAGPVTVEELLEGRTLPSGTFSGRFRLVSVTSSVPGSLGTVNLPARTAVVTVREGSIANQTVLTFTNVFAVNAVVEICKRPALSVPGGVPAGGDSPDVTGFFDFTIDALLNTTISVPVGGCSGPIQVNVPTTPGPFPAPATVLITEIGRPGFTLESASTFPADRFFGLDLNVGVNNTSIACISEPRPLACFFINPGGGVADVDVLEGGTASQTTVNFFNRANPARLKVCKVAGPGIPEGTPFTFEVRGTVASTTEVIAPGMQVTRFITVPAGPAAQGGFCDFVRNADGTFTRFVVGTPIAVNETGFTIPIPGVGPGQVRTANIRSSTGFSAVPVSVSGGAAGTPPVAIVTPCVPTGTVTLTAAGGGNPDYDFGACNTASFVGSAAVVPSRAETVEVEFTNFVFNPTLLKICKIAGPGTAIGTPFTFNVAVTNPATAGLNGPIFAGTMAPATIPVTVQAGPAATGGFCNFAQGPFTPTGTTPPVGTFNVGSTVTITEASATGVTVTAITSPTGTVLAPSLTGRAGGLTLDFRNGFNEISFTNTTGATVAPARPAFDFDGDGKSDPTVFRPSTGTWWYTASGANGEARAMQFGLAGDKLVAADYDGDKRADFAVYRDGTWHINGSSTGYRAQQFGLASDIPQTGDFDGDNKADLAVYRASTGTWYIQGSQDGFRAFQFGIASDKPVAADYDGDNKADAAVYRDGTWHILRSTSGYTAFQFGIATDKPVAADYDGDRKADAAVYRDGTWHLLRSTQGYTAIQFGLAADKPVPADYNGDGRTDLAVYRTGTWHLLASGQGEAGAGYSTVGLGTGTDMPVPAQ